MPGIVRFDCYEVDLAAGKMSKRGRRVRLPDQAFTVLAALLERPGEAVTREEIRRRLWPDDVFVDFDNIINTSVAHLRRALCDSAERPRFVETLPKRGYRFIASVTAMPVAPGRRPSGRPRLLVLPLVNTSAEPVSDEFSDAMTDELITALAAFAPEHLAVLARTTAFRYKGAHEDVQTVGRALGLDYLVEGGARRAGERAVLNVRLVRASDAAHLWAEQYTTSVADVFATHQEIARAIGGKLGITRTRPGAPRKPTADLEAYTLYQQGRHHMLMEKPDGFEAARNCFERAIARDPQFALAYDALAELFFYVGFMGFAPPKEMGGPGMCCAVKALQIDPDLAETHSLLGLYHWLLNFDWVQARLHHERARELNPTSPLVRVRYAISLIGPGRLEEAIAEVEAARESDPLSIMTLTWLWCVYWLDRRYERALEQSRLIIDIAPANYLGPWSYGACARDMGRYSESIAAHRKAVELSGGSMSMLGWLGLALGQAGEHGEARALLERLRQASLRTYVPPTSFAWIHVALGEFDEAFEWLERAVEGRDNMVVALQTYAFLEPLRGDPRYLQLLRKFNSIPFSVRPPAAGDAGAPHQDLEVVVPFPASRTQGSGR